MHWKFCGEVRAQVKWSYSPKNQTNIKGNFWRWWRCLLPWFWWWFPEYMPVSKLIKSYLVNRCGFLSINYSSIKLFRRKKKKKKRSPRPEEAGHWFLSCLTIGWDPPQRVWPGEAVSYPHSFELGSESLLEGAIWARYLCVCPKSQIKRAVFFLLLFWL